MQDSRITSMKVYLAFTKKKKNFKTIPRAGRVTVKTQQGCFYKMDFLSGSKPTKNVQFYTKKMCNSSRIFSQELVTEGLESTLIRNLTDHLGNNLLHCVCSAGHTPLLPLLTSRFGNELTGALSDENRKGLTPVQIAIKVSKCVNNYCENRG